MKNDNYDNFAKTFAKSRKNMSWGELDAIIEDIDKNNFYRIIDIGCGSGRFLEFFVKNLWKFPEKYLGVDNSKEIISEAKRVFPDADFVVAEMQEIDENFLVQNNSQKFDAIVLLASFHHLQIENERNLVLENLYKILAENGKIYMTNWNLRNQEKYKKSEKSPWEFFIKIGDFTRYYHGFALEELEKLFVKNNFIIEKNEIFDGGRNFLTILKK